MIIKLKIKSEIKSIPKLKRLKITTSLQMVLKLRTKIDKKIIIPKLRNKIMCLLPQPMTKIKMIKLK